MKTLVLTRTDVQRLLTPQDCVRAVEDVFRAFADGKAKAPGVLGMHGDQGSYHIKAGFLQASRPYFVAKVNANFPGNPKTNGLPTIQGVIVVSDAGNGQMLALIDSIEITALRTAAATAVATKYLSRPDARTMTIIGCGIQGEVSASLVAPFRKFEKVLLYDTQVGKAKALKEKLDAAHRFQTVVVDDLQRAVSDSDIVITCTPSRKGFLSASDVRPGTFIAAVGADNEDKQELLPDLMAKGKVVVDILDQCAKIGDLHHALDAGVMKKEDVYATLGEIVSERKAPPTFDGIVIFDSTGTALQDVATASLVYENATKSGKGMQVDFNDA